VAFGHFYFLAYFLGTSKRWRRWCKACYARYDSQPCR